MADTQNMDTAHAWKVGGCLAVLMLAAVLAAFAMGRSTVGFDEWPRAGAAPAPEQAIVVAAPPARTPAGESAPAAAPAASDILVGTDERPTAPTGYERRPRERDLAQAEVLGERAPAGRESQPAPGTSAPEAPLPAPPAAQPDENLKAAPARAAALAGESTLAREDDGKEDAATVRWPHAAKVISPDADGFLREASP